MAVKALFTSEDLCRWQAMTGKDYELVEGELYEIIPPNARHGQIVVRLAALIDR